MSQLLFSWCTLCNHASNRVFNIVCFPILHRVPTTLIDLSFFIDPHTRPAFWDHCWTIPYICWEEEKLQRSSGGVTMRDHDKWLLDSKYTRWHIFCGGASGWQQQLVTQSASWQLISSPAYLTSTSTAHCEGMGENTEPRLTFHARPGDWHSYFGQWLAIVTIIGYLIPSHELNSSIKYHSISVKAHLKAFIMLINGGSFLDLCSG